MAHRVEILDIAPITHNVRRYRFERPIGYDFTAGQATEAAIAKAGWEDKKRPFTFTGLSTDPYLEFVIKSYFDHDGVTKELWSLQKGNALLLDDAWETIPYHGPGTFIAGGAGITPFLALLRWLDAENKLFGHRLIFSNTTEEDIILRDELEAMQGLERLFTVTSETAHGLLNERIDRSFLKNHLSDFSGNFYLCGPDKMTAEIRETLVDLGADAAKVIIAD